MSKKYCYLFTEGNATMRELLGGKGANLAEMTNIGLPVPQGFTITTEACTQYYEDGRKINDEIMDEIMQYVETMEKINGKKFGDLKNPLLVSVRSGARASMPGMMDTILNLGLNEDVVAAMIKGNPDPKFERFVYDSYRRFIQMFSDVVMEVGKKYFEQLIDKMKADRGITYDVELTAADLKELAAQFKAEYKKQIGSDFPSDPKVQLYEAIRAVFRSWDNPRANVYRRDNDIPYSWGTAVNVMPMVFGNLNEQSGTGVAFTRNPATGEKKLMGEFLTNAQGEDVVAGIRTPNPLNDDTKNEQNKHMHSMQELMPETYKELCDIRSILEKNYHDMLDIEFTIQDGKLYMLQCRVGKRTGVAALTMAMDMLKEGLIDESEVVMRISPAQLDELLHPILDAADEKKHTVLAKGLPAGPGGAVGVIALTSEKAKEYNAAKIKNILVREETNPEDVEGMRAADGILTARGGMTSHAALVARGWGKCCIVGCDAVKIDMAAGTVTMNGKTFKEGDLLSLNGSKGWVYDEEVKMINATENPLFQQFMKLVDKFRKMGVRTNADNPADAQKAIDFGAEGIGLFRIEHMFYGENSEKPLEKLRNMILANTREERIAALDELEPYIRESAKGTLKVMDGKPLTFRLMDPPLHEFAPQGNEKMQEAAKRLGISYEDVKKRVESLHEVNPMMGLRGVRLGIIYPEITRVQFRALFSATCELMKEGMHPMLEIMVPLTINAAELKHQKAIANEVKDEVEKKYGIKFEYKFGTMIEIPRAALVANQIAEVAEFFSFGTNDLTQMTFGFSRDDVNAIVKTYIDEKIIPADPFNSFDRECVGELVKIGIERGRGTRANLKCGVCGEHGGDPTAAEFFYKAGMNYVSCSPFRVPVARLAAAQAAIKEAREM